MRGHGFPDVLPNFIAEGLGETCGPVALVGVKLVQALLDSGVAAGPRVASRDHPQSLSLARVARGAAWVARVARIDRELAAREHAHGLG